MSIYVRFALTLILAVFSLRTSAGDAIDPAKADADYAIQGEYAGEITRDGAASKTGVQVIALGGGKFHAVLFPGGLPGDGADKTKKQEADGSTADGTTTLTNAEWVGVIKDGTLTLSSKDNKELGKLKHVIRESPTAGAKPPDGALVLFDGTNVDQWQKGAKISEDKLLIQGVTTAKKFGACTLHVEFMLSYMPNARGQGRSNSGVYMQDRYEVQVLDSFGLKGENNEAGGIYEISAPTVNMCFPPLSWQTYDIDFTPAQYEGGKKVKNARMTVKHNGVLVQQDTEVPRTTRASHLQESAEPGPIYLQDHGNQVRYRNVWIVEKK